MLARLHPPLVAVALWPLVAVALWLAPLLAAAPAADWPVWRGPQYDNTSTETGLPDSWDPRGGPQSNLLWKSDALGSRSTPIVLKGKLYLLARHNPGTETEAEKVVCADAATGKVLWEHVFNVYLSDVPDTRVGWSSVVGDPQTGRVYAQGVCGYFCCLEGETGKPVWERSLHEELGFLSTYGGRTNFPVVYKDTVITSAVVIGWGDTPQWQLMAKPAHRFMAFDKATGELRWLSGTTLIPEDTTYSTPALARIGGQDLLVFGSGDGKVWGMKAGTGETVWSFPLSRRGVNTSPVVGPDGRVYCGHSEENVLGNTMGLFAAMDGAKPGAQKFDDAVWFDPESMIGKASPLLIDGRVYAVSDSAKLVVYDAKSGKQLGRRALGRTARATPLYADGKIYFCSNEGMVWVLKPSDRGVDVLDKDRLGGEEINGSPIAADGRLYIGTNDRLYCLALPGAAGASASPAPPADAADVSPDAQPTHLQVSPWDVLLKPGQTQRYAVRLFDDHGRLLREASADEVKFTVTGPGEVSADGEYRAPQGAGHECALVTATLGDLKGQARIRVTPPLPWTFDFEGLSDVPLTWVQGRVRYNLREEGGNHYIAKPTELPTRPGAPTTKLGTRSQMWMGSPELSDYTVQADVQLKEGTGAEQTLGARAPEGPPASADALKLPCVGLINSRYIFALFGPSNEVRLYSWCTHDKRTQAVKRVTLEPGTWYTMKTRVEPDQEAGVARVSGKLWPRGDAEPEAWTLEFVDRAPNYSGSPGLFGDSKDAEFYVDNLSVVPN